MTILPAVDLTLKKLGLGVSVNQCLFKGIFTGGGAKQEKNAERKI